ncbi:hypothetical protein EUGRSUZ_F00906 [Eucalyptus grandis]|uniref:Uncharacterized protein n=2 Tax=Eucalyptus grandis TaxID=71139 RepID=A0ACC3KCS4_EUCGR|nr:hypothetical protein EUGRSUZ_F00906 [Eucalyptus grandis]
MDSMRNEGLNDLNVERPRNRERRGEKRKRGRATTVDCSPSKGSCYATNLHFRTLDKVDNQDGKMPRLEDIAWKFVIRQGKKWRCPYCKIEYSGSVTRVKSHFLKQPKEGIVSCTKVPEHISTLMELLQSQVDNKNDIAWKFVDRLGENKWRCHHCREEFFGDLTGVRGHLLEAPYKGISICTEVPDHVRTLMRSLLDEVAEGGSRELAEEQSRDAEPQSRDVLSPAFPPSSQSSERATDMENSNYDLECRFHETSAMPSLAQNILGESMSCLPMTLAGVESFLFDLPERSECSIQSQMQLNDQQTPAGTLASHYDQLPAAGMSNCLRDSNQHSQLQIPVDIDPSIASQHTIDSHVIWVTILGLPTPEVAADTIGPSSSSQDVSLLI